MMDLQIRLRKTHPEWEGLTRFCERKGRYEVGVWDPLFRGDLLRESCGEGLDVGREGVGRKKLSR